ncbi:hypothetical protein V6N12_052371 [Hibiscus sabdariffa]|uniref:Uncharacterized protein n=1 Tax=Hibiscus sabdariffa TaxID=183260 RepID=A0ABR2GIQ1_9ROSI
MSCSSALAFDQIREVMASDHIWGGEFSIELHREGVEEVKYVVFVRIQRVVPRMKQRPFVAERLLEL